MKKNTSLRISKEETEKYRKKLVSKAETVGDKTENSDTNSLEKEGKSHREQT